MHEHPPVGGFPVDGNAAVKLRSYASKQCALRVIRGANKSGTMHPASVSDAVEVGQEVTCACAAGGGA
ncbi:MAG: hypothetical protein ABGY95_00480 [Rubritalea sp.]